MFGKLLLLAFVTMAVAKDLNYVGFVVDDTGSMSNEIAAVKSWIENCTNGQNQDCHADRYLITTFNDPTTGNVTGPTDDITAVLEHVKGISVDGGGDCPELLYEGVQKVIEAIPDPLDVKNCKIFVFTDATAKDESLHGDVATALKKKGCSFVPILTGCCGKCADPCVSVSEEYCIDHVTDTTAGKPGRSKRSTGTSLTGEALFYALAESTGGTIYVTEKPSSSEELLVFLEEKVTLGFCPTSDIAGPLPRGYICESDCVQKGMCWDRSVGRCFCKDSSACTHKYPVLSKCPGETKINCKRSMSSKYFRDVYNCQRFFVCASGKKFSFKCAEGKVYSDKKSSCDDIQNVPPPCGTATKKKKTEA